MKQFLRILMLAALVLLPLATRAQQDCTTPIEVYAGHAFAEDFEGSANIPACWTVSGPGVWSVGVGDNYSSTGTHGGSRNAVITHGTSGNATKLITPVLDLSNATGAQLTFWQVRRSWSGDIDGLKIYYRDDTTATAIWTQLEYYSTSCEVWTESVVTLPNLSSTYQVAFEFIDAWGYGLGIDDIYIGLPPTCFPVLGLAIDESLTTEESLTLVWHDTSSSSAAYTIYNVTDGEEVSSGYSDTTITITGLSASTAYTFSVTTECGADDMSTPVFVSGRTACGDITTLPWVEDFSSYTSINTEQLIPCWTKGMSPTGNYPIVNEEGELYFYYSSYYGGNSSMFWAVSPTFGDEISMNELELSFTYNNYYDYNSTLIVGIIDTQSYVPGTTPIDTIAVLAVNSQDPINAYLSLADYEGDGHNIIFIVKGLSGTYATYAVIDNIDLHLLPTCPRPTDLALTGASPTSATFTWSGSATSYMYTLFNSADNSVVATDEVADTTVTIENLVRGNDYYFRLVAVCGEGDTAGSIPDVNVHLDYCVPSPSSIDGSGITNVTFGVAEEQVNNTQRPTSAPYYGDYSAMVGAVQAGTTAEVSITFGTGYTYGTIIWVDWNNNFQLEGSEVVYYGMSTNANPTTLTASMVVPATQDTGLYRMRIAAADGFFDNYVTSAAAAATAPSCFEASYAVVHDYTLHVTEAPECLPPADLTIVTLSTESVTIAWSGDASNYEYMLKVGDSVVATDVVSDTMATITDLTGETNYVFSVSSDCGSDQSLYSNIAFFTGYCSPDPTSVDGAGITNVTFGVGDEVVNNNQGPSVAPYYGNYSSMVGAVAASSELNVSITYSTGYTYGTVIWVDWNRNMIFDGNEVVWVGESDNSTPTTMTASFEVPTTQDTGLYRMRIAGADSYFDNYTSSITAAAAADPCFSTNYAVAHDYTLHVLEAPDCLSPRNLTLDSAGAETLSLSWTPQGDESQWIVVLNDTIQQLVTDTAVTIENLEPNTEYAVAVYAYCGGTDTSFAVTGVYRTTCVRVANLPWHEGFENYPAGYYSDNSNIFSDQCWDVLDRYPGYPFVYTGEYVHSGSNSLSLFGANSMVVLPLFDQPVEDLQLSFWAISSPDVTLEIGVLVDPADASTFQVVSTLTPSTYYESGYVEVTFDGRTTANAMAIRYTTNTYYASNAYIDDITVMLAPSCSKPQSVFMRDISTDGATVVIADTNEVMNYHLVLLSGADTAYNQVVTDTVVIISGLTPGTIYNICASAICSDGIETSPANGMFSTECVSIATLPYTENFEAWPSGYNAPFNPCWVKGSSTGESSYPYIGSENNNKYMAMYGYSDYVYAIMPTIDESIDISGLELSFDVSNAYGDPSTLLVGLVDTLVYASTTAIDTIATLNITSSTYTTQYVSFGNYQGQKRYILLLCKGNFSSNYAYIDNMNLHLIPTCPRPENIVATVDATTVTYEWVGEEDAYQYRLMPQGSDSVVSTGIVADTTVTIDNLDIDVDYVFEVRSVCGAGDTGIWVSCQPVHIGYCTPNATSVDGLGITNVTFGTTEIVNNSARPTVAPFYGNYTNLVGDVAAGDDVDVLITYATGYDYGTIIWVDWNNDMSFDGTEVVYYGMSASANPTVLTATISVPGIQDTGLYRMRIAGADIYFSSYVTSAAMAATADPCFSSTYAVAHDYTLRVTGALSCVRPSNLTLDDATTSSLTVSWTPSGEESSWLVRLNDSTWQTATTPTYTFSGLDANTPYTVSVRAYCGGTDTSSAVSDVFRTQCAVISLLPHTETFEAADMGCWLSDGQGEWTVGVGDYSSSTGAFEGAQNAKIVHATTGSTTKLLSPVIDIDDVDSLKLTFAHVQRAWGSDIDAHRVLYRLSAGGDWVEAANYTGAIASWTVDSLMLPGNTYQIAFEYTDHYGYGVGLDSIVIEASGAGVITEDTLTVTLAVNDATLGSVAPAAGIYDYVAADSVVYSATPATGSVFVAWHVVYDNGTTDSVLTARYAILAGTLIDNGVRSMTVTAVFRSTVGIDDVSADMNIFVTGNRIVVRGAEGEDIYIYDLNGRTVATKANAGETMEFTMESSGVYMVKVGNAPAKRVLVVR